MWHKCLFCMSDHIKVIGTRSFNNLLTFSVWFWLGFSLSLYHSDRSISFLFFRVAPEKRRKYFENDHNSAYECYSCRIRLFCAVFLHFGFAFASCSLCCSCPCLLNSNLRVRRVCVCVPKTRGRSSMASNKPGIKCNNLIVVVVVVIVILNRSGGEIFKEWYHRAKECAIRGEFLLAVLFFSFSASRPNDTQTESLRSIHSLLLSCYKCIKAHRNFRSAPYS